jgi:hypothetical protein
MPSPFPQTKRRTWTITLTGAALLSAVAWGSQIVAPVSSAASAVNQHWVPRDTFDAYQEGLERRQLTDSINHRDEILEIRRMVAGLDSSDRCRRGLRGYCR